MTQIRFASVYFFVWSCVDMCIVGYFVCFFFKQKTAYEMRISDWSSDVCSSDLLIFADRQLLSNDLLDLLFQRTHALLLGTTCCRCMKPAYCRQTAVWDTAPAIKKANSVPC